MSIRKRLNTTHIVVHCSATPPTMDIGAKEIRKWHVEGNGWSDIGYHFVIRRDGTVEAGRAIDAVGAHAPGMNDVAVAVCLVGGINADAHPVDNFVPLQMAALEGVIGKLRVYYPKTKILGHRDVPGVKKACPSFDVKAWCKTVFIDPQ